MKSGLYTIIQSQAFQFNTRAKLAHAASYSRNLKYAHEWKASHHSIYKRAYKHTLKHVHSIDDE